MGPFNHFQIDSGASGTGPQRETALNEAATKNDRQTEFTTFVTAVTKPHTHEYA